VVSTHFPIAATLEKRPNTTGPWYPARPSDDPLDHKRTTSGGTSWTRRVTCGYPFRSTGGLRESQTEQPHARWCRSLTGQRNPFVESESGFRVRPNEYLSTLKEPTPL